MKTYISKMLCTFLFFCSIASSAQYLSITSTSGFNQLEPETQYTYTVTPQGLPSGVDPNSYVYAWSQTFGTATSSSNTSNYDVKWKNLPDNGYVKAVYITFKYTKDKKEYSLIASQPVFVKYIGEISNISVNGTTISNGGSSSNIPCGTGNITVASAIPDTYPNATVIYTWTLPGNWSTANYTTTTNSINVTPDVTGGGTILVSAKRSDGTTTQSASITVNRAIVPPNPPLITSFGAAQGTLNGGVLLCSNANFTNSSATNATEYRWSTTGGTVG